MQISAPSGPGWKTLETSIALFPCSRPFNPEEPWLKEATGRDPEARSFARASSTASVQIDGRALVCEITPLRSQWTVRQVQSSGFVTAEGLFTGDFPAPVDSFIELVGSWLRNRNDIRRIGLSIHLMRPMEDRNATYDELRRLIPSLKIGPDWEDLQLRLNRKSPSEEFGFSFNALRTWSSVVLSPVDVARAIASGQSSQLKGEHFCSLELDINTPNERTEPLQQEAMPQMLIEMLRIAERIASEGNGIVNDE